MSKYVKIDKQYTEKLCENWAPVIDVEGLDDVKTPAMRDSLAIVLENALNELVKSGFNPKAALLKEDTFSNGIDSNLRNGIGNRITAGQQDWKSGDVRIPLAVIPLARRMFTQLLAHEVVGVQAMASPTGYAAAFRYVYGTGDDKGKELIWGAFDPAFSGTMDYSGDPKQTGYASGEMASDTSDMLANFGIETAESVVDGQRVMKLKKASGFDVATGENMSFNPVPGSTDTAIPRLAMKLEKVLVEAKTRKIGTSISMEDAEDALVSLGLDVNEAMVNILATDLKNSIDRELLQEIVLACLGTKERADKCFSIWDATKADGLDQLGRLSTLYTHILQMSKRIQYNSKMGNGANWMISSSPVSALVERIGDWKLADNDVSVDGTAIAYAGTLRRGQIKVYNDALNNSPYILLGWKGSDIVNTGVIFCPYVPAQILSGPDVDKFGARLMSRSRYAIVSTLFGTELYYQLINLKNINVGEAIVSGTQGAKVFATL